MSIWSKVKGFVSTVTGRMSANADGTSNIAEVGKPVDAQHQRREYSAPLNVVSGRHNGGKSMLAAKLQATQRLVVPDPPYRRSTTALRRFQRDANRQYLHVSVPITHEIQRLVSMFGERWFRHAHKGRGITYYRGQANG